MPQFSTPDILNPSTPTTTTTTQYCIAKALYNNIPDAPDELAFEKGDQLIVLEQNTGNFEGWWLCALKGRQGICPANRLRLIPGYYETSMQPKITYLSIHENNCKDMGYRYGKTRSWVISPNQMSTTKMFNDIYLYDTPPSRCSPVSAPGGLSPGLSPGQDQNFESYDTLPSHNRPIPVAEDDPSFHSYDVRCSPAPGGVSLARRDLCETYDVPKSIPINSYHRQHQELTPSSSASSLTADLYSLSSSNRSSLTNMPEYDVPRPSHHHCHRPGTLATPTMANQIYDVPVPQQLQQQQPQIKELPLELNSALENLERLENDMTSATSRLLAFVSPNWRTRSKLENTLMDIRLAVTRLRTSLHDLAEFAEGSLGNAAKASDKNLVVKLTPLVTSLRRSDRLIQDAAETLEKHKWSIEHLARPEEADSKTFKQDELEQLIACSRALTVDVRQISSFIQGNGTLLFKREKQRKTKKNPSSPTTIVPQLSATSPTVSKYDSNQQSTAADEEYDYVSFDTRDNIKNSQKQILEQLPTPLQKGYDNCIRQADDVANEHECCLSNDDRYLLTFYAAQAVTYTIHLTQAIDAFLQTIEHSQPPKVFLAHGKFVVLNAHKLVSIGDTVHRNMIFKEIKDRTLNCSNALADALATSVSKTKQAAQQFPSVTAVQEMVDSILEVSQLATDLKVCLVQAANP